MYKYETSGTTNDSYLEKAVLVQVGILKRNNPNDPDDINNPNHPDCPYKSQLVNN